MDEVGVNPDQSTIEPEQQEPLSYTEILQQACPIYMNYGMTYEQFWYDDVNKAPAYAAAHKLRMKSELENDNFKMWLQGVYVDAACQNLAQTILNSFSKHPKNKLKSVYPQEPIKLEKEQSKPLTVEEEVAKLDAFFASWK